MEPSRTATDLVKQWDKDYREVLRLSDEALGELMKRIADAIAANK